MMKKRLLGISIFLILAACASSQSPEAEPILTAALEKSPVEPVAEIVAEAVDMAIPTDTAVPAPTVTAISLEQAAAVAIADTATAASVAPDVLLVFERSGGFAGLQQQWTIYGDGRVEMPDGTQKRADADQIQALLETIEAAGFFDLDDSYESPIACADCFTYSITVQVDGQSQAADMTDDTLKQPEQLTTILETIRVFLSDLDNAE